jgi:hypothetical protein
VCGVGFCFGGMWPLTVRNLTNLLNFQVAMIHELFGSSHWGFNYGIILLGVIPGNYLLATLMAGKLYEQHITDGGNNCYGHECYEETFFITAGLCAFAAILNVFLIFKTKSVYNHFYQEAQKRKGLMN